MFKFKTFLQKKHESVSHTYHYHNLTFCLQDILSMIIIGMIFTEGFVEDYCLSKKKLFPLDFYFINYFVGSIKLSMKYFHRYLLMDTLRKYYVSKVYCNLWMENFQRYFYLYLTMFLPSLCFNASRLLAVRHVSSIVSTHKMYLQ
jgi:hypothetical protein